MKKHLHIFFSLFTIAMWGTTFVSTKVLINVGMSPVQIMLARFVLAYVTLLLLYPKMHRSEGLKQELFYVALALSGSTIYFLLENYAVSFTQASNVSLVMASAPIITSFVAHVSTHDEKFSRGMLFGFFSAFTGIFLVVCNGHFVLKISPIGDFFALGAAIVWACYCVLMRKMSSKYPLIYCTRRMFFYSIVTLIPFHLVLDAGQFDFMALKNPIVTVNLLFLGVIASSICYVMWNHVIRVMGAVKANNFVYMSPMVTMIASVLVLNERITPLMILGALLILMGVMLADGIIPIGRRKTVDKGVK